MPELINPADPRYQLGVDQMDQTHLEFIDLVNGLHGLERIAFTEQFIKLGEHTLAHFEAENRLMAETGFAAIREHMDEHQRMLGELNVIARQVSRGTLNIARAYVSDRLPEWFNLHAMTMDSALAAHLKHVQVINQQGEPNVRVRV